MVTAYITVTVCIKFYPLPVLSNVTGTVVTLSIIYNILI